MINIETEGLKEFRKKLEALDGNFKKALKKGVMKGARKVAKDGNSNAHSRGFSMSKYYFASEASYTRQSDTAIVVKVGTKSLRRGVAPQKNKTAYYKSQGDYFYVRFPEYGTVHQAPQPTLKPALESNKEYIKECVEDAFNKEIKKLGG